ncbi:MAG: polyphosphate polymerase domain-containing protein [Clostridia bacterium]|nr:polyphosphate polymerase domain-containing protein [Clostridia bacterium]
MRSSNPQPEENLRHELKYFINPGDTVYLRNVLGSVLDLDRNAGPDGGYHIRSLYFDDAYNSALQEKIDGVYWRDKYRIRIYNYSDATIKLEKKSKRGDLTKKESVTITRELAEQIISGDAYGLDKINHPLINELYRMITIKKLHPVVLVDYYREAFVHIAEDTRITLDQELRSGVFSLDLFNPHVPTVSPFGEEQNILEVKYNRRLPSFIPVILQNLTPVRSAISKYTLCRRFEYNY